MRTVKVGLAADVSNYIRGIVQGKDKTGDFVDELQKAARTGDLAAVAANDFGKQALGASRDVDRLASSAEDATDEVRQLDRAMDKVGGTFSGTVHDFKTLDTEIDRTHKSVLDLAREVSRDPGDSGLLRQLQRERGRLKRLLDVKDLLPGEDDGRESADSISRGFSGRFIAGIGTTGARAGLQLSQSIGSGFGASSPVLSSAIGAAIVAAIALAAPAVGAAASAAITGGVGGAGLAGGLMLAFQNPKVKAAATALGEHVTAELRDAADSFVPASLNAIEIVGDGFDRMSPRLERIFDRLAPHTSKLARALVDAIEESLPGLERAVDRSEVIFDTIERGLPAIGRAFSRFFDDSTVNINGARLALEDLIKGTARLVDFAGKAIGFLSGVYEKYRIILGIATGDVVGLVDVLAGRNKELQRSNEELAPSFDWASTASTKIGFLREAYNRVGPQIEDAAKKIRIMTGDMGEAIDAAGGLKQALDEITGANVDVSKAESAFEQAVDDAAAAIGKKVDKLDLGTQRGRDYNARLLEIRDSAVTLAQATYDQTGSQEKANTVIANARTQLYNTARQMGLSKDEARRYVDQILRVPKSWNTKFSADTGTASNKIEGLRKQVKNLQGKTITITTRFVTSGRYPGEHIVGGIGAGTQVANRWGGVYEHAAVGVLREATVASPMGPARYAYAEPATGGEAFIPKFGDWGRSMQILNRAAGWYGAQVMPRAMATARPVINVTVTPVAAHGDRLMSEVVRGMRYVVRVDGGGNVQKALGQ